MFYVYFLKSLTNDDIYIGSCEDLQTRFAKHNKGKVISTNAYSPWKLLGPEKCQTRSEAVKKNVDLKPASKENCLRKNIRNSKVQW